MLRKPICHFINLNQDRRGYETYRGLTDAKKITAIFLTRAAPAVSLHCLPPRTNLCPVKHAFVEHAVMSGTSPRDIYITDVPYGLLTRCSACRTAIPCDVDSLTRRGTKSRPGHIGQANLAQQQVVQDIQEVPQKKNVNELGFERAEQRPARRPYQLSGKGLQSLKTAIWRTRPWTKSTGP